MVATAIYSVTMVLWKETAFPLCRAMERRWKRNVVSRVSSTVIVVIRLPISCVSSMAISCHIPAVSMANGYSYYYLRTYTQQGGVRERSDAAELDRGKVGARPDVILPVRRSPVNAQRPAFLTVTVSHLHSRPVSKRCTR